MTTILLIGLPSLIGFAASLVILWLTLRRQAERDRQTRQDALIDRHRDELRSALELLLLAAEAAKEAAAEIRLFPKGHPPRGIVSGAISQHDHDPFATFDGIIEETKRLYTQGEVALVLAAGPDDPVLAAWEHIQESLEVLVSSINAGAHPDVIEQATDSVRNATDRLRRLAHERLEALGSTV
jgi:hypothetical protein